MDGSGCGEVKGSGVFREDMESGRLLARNARRAYALCVFASARSPAVPLGVLQGKHSLDVPGHGDQVPFSPHVVEAPQVELSEGNYSEQLQ